MQFQKIAYTPPKDGRLGTVRLAWETTKVTADGDLALDERTLKSNDEPHPAFLAALAGLKPAVLAACFATVEESETAEADGLTVRSVTLKEMAGEDGDDIDGVTITALRQLPWTGAPLVLNTPFSPVENVPYQPLAARLNTLTLEAERFVQGKRAQGSLFGGDGAAGAVADAVEAIRPDEGSVTITSGGSGVRLNADGSNERIGPED